LVPRLPQDRTLAGIILLLAAYLCFTGIDTCAKVLALAGLPPMESTFVRYAVHFLLTAALFLPREGLALARAARPGAAVLRAAFLLGSTLCNFTAVRYLPLTVTAAILMTVPLWTCLLAIPLLGERIGPRRWAAILAGFCGVLVVTRPWGGEAHWAVLLSVAAAVFTALYSVFTRRLAGVDSTATLQFYAASVATLGVAPLAVADWHWPQMPSAWAAFALIGVFGWLGHQVLTIAYRLSPVTTLAPFVYSQIVYMSAASWLFFAEAPTVPVIVGGTIVVASGLLVWATELRLAGIRA
jgi:drug/metabolite transporter (DMT)-like permease